MNGVANYSNPQPSAWGFVSSTTHISVHEIMLSCMKSCGIRKQMRTFLLQFIPSLCFQRNVKPLGRDEKKAMNDKVPYSPIDIVDDDHNRVGHVSGVY